MLRYNLENRNGLSLYEYLYECIKKDILSGRLPAKSKLPSKRQLAVENHISVKTVMNAYEQLLMEGYLYSQEKKGYFVADIEIVPEYHRVDVEYPTLYKEEQWFADFTENNTIYENFPYTLWRKTMREVLSEYDIELVRRSHFQGIKELREALADYLYRVRGMQVSPEYIIIGSGIEYLYYRLMNILPSDGIFAVENPGYQKISLLYEQHEVKWKYVDLDENGINIKSLREIGADIIHVSPEHHYPLGTVMSVTRRQEVLKWAKEKIDRYIIEYDYDCEFRYHSKVIPTLYSLDRNNCVIYINTFSKTLAPAIRISYMILPEKLMRRYLDTANFNFNTASTCEQYALTKFIQKEYFERHVSKLKKYYYSKGQLLIHIIRESSLLPVKEIIGGNSGTHLLVRLDTTLTDTELKQMARQRGINIMCLSEFCGIIKPQYQHVMVLNYSGLEENTLKIAIKRLEDIFV